MNSKLWIRKFAVTLLVMASLVFSQIGCDKAKTIEKLERTLIELRMHNRSIAKITNDQFEAGKLDRSILAAVIPACDAFSKALDGGDAAVAAAKLVTEKSEVRTALDFAKRIVDVEAFPAFLGVVKAVVNVPPEIEQKIDELLAAIRAAFALIQILMSDAQIAAENRRVYV